ncbi:MAG: Na+/H+ antiporter subunit E [Thermodesulfobacteriota bacterium]
MFKLATFFLLAIVWLLLSGRFDPFHLTLGSVACLLVTQLSHDLLFQERGKGLRVRFREAWRFIPYCGWLLWQIVLANLHVIALALSPNRCRRDLDPHVITFRTRLTTDFARFVLANSITLTPGTITIRIEGDLFHVHAISRHAAGDLAEGETMSEMERRVAWVFEGGA